MATNFKQGYFYPKYIEKYLGDVNEIVYRSSWELHAFEFLDRNPNILRWGSEIIAIPYMKPDPINNSYKKANYFPDIYVEYKNETGEIIKELIEIKPLKQTRASRSKNQAVKLQENAVYLINIAKWNAAKIWCDARGITFSKVTEKSIFLSKRR